MFILSSSIPQHIQCAQTQIGKMEPSGVRPKLTKTDFTLTESGDFATQIATTITTKESIILRFVNIFAY